mmetsp:Transcript_15896/g.32303  ORF Transcript_15896/g.32303 Transcript_15896/m.32303 type:complete len:215 (-) Transcript_15896:478-1122(-)
MGDSHSPEISKHEVEAIRVIAEKADDEGECHHRSHEGPDVKPAIYRYPCVPTLRNDSGRAAGHVSGGCVVDLVGEGGDVELVLRVDDAHEQHHEDVARVSHVRPGTVRIFPRQSPLLDPSVVWTCSKTLSLVIGVDTTCLLMTQMKETDSRSTETCECCYDDESGFQSHVRRHDDLQYIHHDWCNLIRQCGPRGNEVRFALVPKHFCSGNSREK